MRIDAIHHKGDTPNGIDHYLVQIFSSVAKG
jgi:hypothetical protein